MSVFGKDKAADGSAAGAALAAASAQEDNSKIHIFSVASGHLYERFLKIMILSVLRQTKTPVKFWFISNYMSPKCVVDITIFSFVIPIAQLRDFDLMYHSGVASFPRLLFRRFKEFLPEFAAEYKFDYGLITYKWPTWLNKQTEKQRIIWAYKVLFLDVLFPLSLDRVIFVDADQIVRADMRELMQMDLKGAPYAYTPMCDNNKEMEGYRFWKQARTRGGARASFPTRSRRCPSRSRRLLLRPEPSSLPCPAPRQGFWKDHLRGRPYHISALYVVDLTRFRAMAAGDQLRIMYDNLSKDPNSLANLDQDLPNYAQGAVPIFSLPQEWLWCESWCGNATKPAAKTIDLCNNPMTKEPKLEGARRIVAEWVELDEEARAALHIPPHLAGALCARCVFTAVRRGAHAAARVTGAQVHSEGGGVGAGAGVRGGRGRGGGGRGRRRGGRRGGSGRRGGGRGRRQEQRPRRGWRAVVATLRAVAGRLGCAEAFLQKKGCCRLLRLPGVPVRL